MSTYVVGDIQGCFDTLMVLLERLSFDEKKDKLIAVGDLINRGEKSLEVLEFFIDNSSCCDLVLGNHDFWVPLMYHNADIVLRQHQSMLENIRSSHRFADIYDWICDKSVLMEKGGYLLMHAGILPSWSASYAFDRALEVKEFMQNKNLMDTFFREFFVEYKEFFWDESVEGLPRYKHIMDIFTRLRFINSDGSICLRRKYAPKGETEAKPWFQIPREDNQKFAFGHWSMLNGSTGDERYVALDTGCVFGKQLTSLEIETGKIISVDYAEK